MRVLVTGATGFVGVHTVAALVEGGHEVRLFVRAPERVAAHFAPLGVPAESLKDVVAGDVTDAAAVERALGGCDAVVHAASVYSLEPRRAREIERTNVGGTRIVLEAAHRLGLDPIVHVSSYASLLPAREAPLTRDSEPGAGCGPYSKSKADSERVARELQAKGAPVVSVMPGMVWGPHDPYHGETDMIIRDFLRGKSRMMPRHCVMPPVDARDVARVIAAVLEPGRGPRRYLAIGDGETTFIELMDRLAGVTGRRIRYVALPRRLVAATAGMWNLLQRVSPTRLPASTESVRAVVSTAPCDASPIRDELGVEPRPLEETMRDTVVSLVERGYLGREAGLLAR